jgi:hypothetical protein
LPASAGDPLYVGELNIRKESVGGFFCFFLGGSQIGFPKLCLASSWMSEDRRPHFSGGLLPKPERLYGYWKP